MSQFALMPTDLVPDAGRQRRRTLRIGLILSAVICLSVGDLYSTLTHMNSLGMIEVNPIAAHLMYWGSDTAIVLFKLGTLGIAVGLLLHIRRHAASEAGAWVLLVIMTVLTLHWMRYNATLDATLSEAGMGEFPQAMKALAAADTR